MQKHVSLNDLRRFATALLGGVLLLSGIAFAGQAEPQTAKEWFDRGMLYREAGNARSTEAFTKAVQELDGSIAGTNDRGGLSRAYTLRARCYLMLGNARHAVEDLDSALELSPDDADLYYLRSFAHSLLGQDDLSIRDLKLAAAGGNRKARDELNARGIPW